MAAKNQVTTTQENLPEAVPANLTIMQVIAMASRDPRVDVTKMRELIAMKREQDAIDGEIAFDRALTRTQREMEPVLKDTKGEKANTKYASYAALADAVKPIYTGNGFNVSFDTGDAPGPDMVRVLAHVSHNKGHRRTYKIDMPADGKGPKGGDVMSRTHATGSCVTYGKRYLLGMIFDIVTVDKLLDDDGKAAGKVATEADGKISDEQLEQLMAKIVEVAIDIQTVCEKLGVEKIADCPKSKFDRIMSGLNTYGRNMAKAKTDGETKDRPQP
jgi:hypothetical protein